MTYFMLHDPCRQGPFAMLVKDGFFSHDEMGNHNYLSIPEWVEDMGAGIAKLFYDNSKSVIVKFRAIPQFEAEAYLESVLCYLYCALNHKIYLLNVILVMRHLYTGYFPRILST